MKYFDQFWSSGILTGNQTRCRLGSKWAKENPAMCGVVIAAVFRLVPHYCA